MIVRVCNNKVYFVSVAFWHPALCIVSRLRDPLPGHQHVERGVLLDVGHGLLVRDHGEVVSVALQDLVVDAEAGLDGGAVASDLGHVDALK